MEVSRENTTRVGSCCGCVSRKKGVTQVWDIQLRGLKIRLCTDCRDELVNKTANEEANMVEVSSKSGELSEDEVRDALLRHVWNSIDYWDGLPNKGSRERLSGLAFSILAMLDGSNIEIPAFIVAPRPHEDDKLYHQDLGESWYPFNDGEGVECDLGGSLHDCFHKADPKGD